MHIQACAPLSPENAFTNSGRGTVQLCRFQTGRANDECLSFETGQGHNTSTRTQGSGTKKTNKAARGAPQPRLSRRQHALGPLSQRRRRNGIERRCLKCGDGGFRVQKVRNCA
eukprot:3626388-Pleurochrysis_carterae.AAC.1